MWSRGRYASEYAKERSLWLLLNFQYGFWCYKLLIRYNLFSNSIYYPWVAAPSLLFFLHTYFIRQFPHQFSSLSLQELRHSSFDAVMLLNTALEKRWCWVRQSGCWMRQFGLSWRGLRDAKSFRLPPPLPEMSSKSCFVPPLPYCTQWERPAPWGGGDFALFRSFGM